MFFHVRMPLTHVPPFLFAAAYQFMPFGTTTGIPSPHSRSPAGVHIHAPVDPGPAPRPVVDEHRVSTPVKPAVAPAPGTEPRANRYPKSKSDGSANKKPRPRRKENHCWIVIRHHIKLRIHRGDGDVRPAAHNDLRIAAKIAEIPGLLPLSLHCVHHVLTLRQKGVAQGR